MVNVNLLDRAGKHVTDSIGIGTKTLVVLYQHGDIGYVGVSRLAKSIQSSIPQLNVIMPNMVSEHDPRKAIKQHDCTPLQFVKLVSNATLVHITSLNVGFLGPVARIGSGLMLSSGVSMRTLSRNGDFVDLASVDTLACCGMRLQRVVDLDADATRFLVVTNSDDNALLRRVLLRFGDKTLVGRIPRVSGLTIESSSRVPRVEVMDVLS